MKNLFLAGFLLAGIFGAKAQVSIILKNATPQTSSTIAGGNSVIIGDGAGNAVTPAAGANVFMGFISGMSNTTGANNTFLGWGTGTGNSTGQYNTFVGRSAGGGNTTSWNNTFTGALSGLYNTTGSGSSFYGFGSGYSNTTGINNTFIGGSSGNSTTTGLNNVYVGTEAGWAEVTGYNNTFLGFQAGRNNTFGENSMLGFQAGLNSNGNGNTLIGRSAGSKAKAMNVMIGNQAGENAIVDNQLFIDNSNTATPLIWGDFWNDLLKLNGKVGIGAITTFPTNTLYNNYKLFVTGGILTDEVRVALSASGTWADYVFAKDYNLKPLSEVEKFINTNGHLQNVPSAKQVKEEGINVAEMVTIHQEKIEELTLYIIAQNKRIEVLEAKMNNK